MPLTTDKTINLQAACRLFWKKPFAKSKIFPYGKKLRTAKHSGLPFKKHTNIKAGQLDKARNLQYIIGYFANNPSAKTSST